MNQPDPVQITPNTPIREEPWLAEIWSPGTLELLSLGLRQLHGQSFPLVEVDLGSEPWNWRWGGVASLIRLHKIPIAHRIVAFTVAFHWLGVAGSYSQLSFLTNSGQFSNFWDVSHVDCPWEFTLCVNPLYLGLGTTHWGKGLACSCYGTDLYIFWENTFKRGRG